MEGMVWPGTDIPVVPAMCMAPGYSSHTSWCWRGFLDSDADPSTFQPLFCTMFISEASSAAGPAQCPCRALWCFWFSSAIVWAQHHSLPFWQSPLRTRGWSPFHCSNTATSHPSQAAQHGWQHQESILSALRNETFPFCPVKREGYAHTKGQMWHSGYAKITQSPPSKGLLWKLNHTLLPDMFPSKWNN